jgi:hypothetical protein
MSLSGSLLKGGTMLTAAHHYEQLLTSAGRRYRARVYGEQRADGRWAGSLIFVPVDGGRLISTATETTQSTLADLAQWGAGLSDIYLEGALARALALQPEAELARELERLERLEVSAEVRASTLERAAAAARAESRVAEAARERTEERLYETIADNAELDAAAHEQAAAQSRAAAQAAERALDTTRRKAPAKKKKSK